MKNPLRLLTLLAMALMAIAARAQTQAPPQTKPGYTVVLEISYDETGKPEDGKVHQSDDPTGDHTLEQIAMNMGGQDVQPPRVVDGKPVKFKARRPFNFPVEGDQGEAANANKPVLRSGHQAIPVYPPALAEQDVIGGCIVELTIRADGTVRSIETLRASHPEFAQATETALGQWTFLPREGPGMPVESKWRAAVAYTTKGRNVDIKWRLAPRPSLGGFVVGRTPPAAAEAPTAPATPDTPPPVAPATPPPEVTPAPAK